MIDSPLINTMNQVPADFLTSSESQLERKIRAAQSAGSSDRQKAELKIVAQEFEAVFVAYLLKTMRETIEESGLMEGGFGKSIYTDLFDQEVSLSLAKRGTLGISDLVYKSLLPKADAEQSKKNGQPSTPEPAGTTAVPSSPSSQNRETSRPQECEISDLQLPVQASISSAFGMRSDPFSHQARFHKGLDLAAPEGMKVVPALPGTVVSAGYESGYGNTVLIKHPGGLQTRYGHLGSIDVKVGDSVTSQDTLGTVGNTGRSTGPHLHFEVIRMGTPVDPSALYNVSASASDQRLQTTKIGS